MGLFKRKPADNTNRQAANQVRQERMERRQQRLDDIERIQEEHPGAQFVASGDARLAYVSGDWMVIEPRSARKSKKDGSKRLKITTLTAVKFRPAGGWKPGSIRFDQPGTPQVNDRYHPDSGIYNENMISFTKAQMPRFEKLRDYIESQIG